MNSNQINVCFPEKRSLGSLYTADEVFPHQRKWVGEARGAVALQVPAGKMLGVALGAVGWEGLADADSNQLRFLRSIDFSTSQFNEKTLKSANGLVDLAEIRLDFLKFADEDLAQLKEFNALRTIWLTGTSASDNSMSALSKLPALVHLVLRSTKVTDSGVGNLGTIALESLTLPSQISDRGLQLLRSFQSLRRLDLTNTQISDEGLVAIGALSDLEELYLTDTRITDKGVAGLKGLSRLRTLFLSGTKVSDGCLTALEDIATLEHLELRDTGVTEIAIARLRAKLPKCAVFGG